MNVLEVIQSIAPAIGISIPAAIYSSDQRSEQELGALANEMAVRIATVYDWQRIKRLATITGDGTTEAFDLPYDFDRMPNGQELRKSGFSTPRTHVIDHDYWLDLKLRGITMPYGAWTMIGGQFDLYPAPTSGELTKFYYLSNRIVRSNGTAANSSFPYNLPFELADSDAYGYALTEFLTDSDFFQLDWRLLKLGMLWQWKANKGLPYAEDMQNYEVALAQAIARDKGAVQLRIGKRHARGNIAYPWSLG